MAAISCARSIGGATLPLAADPMYKTLGVHWASTLLTFLCLVLGLVPFVLIVYGDQLRAESKFSQQLAREEKEINLRQAVSESDNQGR